MATHSSILAWEIPWTEELGELQCSQSVSSVAQSFSTLCNPMNCSTPDFPVHHQLPELAQTHVHRVSDAIQPSHPLSSPSPPAFNISPSGLFSQRFSSSHHVAKVLEFQLQHQSSNEYSGLVSFRIDWFDFLAVQRTLKSFLQHYSSKASIFQCSAFFMVQLSQSTHDYWKNCSFDYTDLCQQRWLQSTGAVKSWT